MGICRFFIGSNAQTQGVEFDKTACISLVVSAVVVFKSRNFGVKQAVWAAAAHHGDAALEQFQFNRAIDGGLRFVDQLLQQFTLWAEPETVVDHAGIARHQIVFERQHFAVQRDRFNRAVAGQQNRAAWGFVAATAFHAHKAVFHFV